MKNQEIAKIFYEIANYLEIEGVAFKPFAYRKVALYLESSKDDVSEIYRNKGLKALQEIPGVGEGIAKGIYTLQLQTADGKLTQQIMVN